MLFNLEMCLVIHMGKSNQELAYEIGGKEVLRVSEEERGFGAIMHKKKSAGQCAKASRKARIQF